MLLVRGRGAGEEVGKGAEGPGRQSGERGQLDGAEILRGWSGDGEQGGLGVSPRGPGCG